MTSYSLNLPNELKQEAEQAWETANIEQKAKRGRWEKFQQVLKKVPDVEPEACDRI